MTKKDIGLGAMITLQKWDLFLVNIFLDDVDLAKLVDHVDFKKLVELKSI